MKKLSISKMTSVSGGTKVSAAIGGAACAGAMLWPIGTLIFGPTCMGMVIYTIYD